MSKIANEHWGIVESAWKVIEKGYLKYYKQYPELIFHEEKKEDFEKAFQKRYEDVMLRFMQEGTGALDSHKQAAIITIVCLETNIIEHKLSDIETLSIIPQVIAVNAGLSYMRECMNDTLKEKGINKRIDKYYFPVAIACDTPYQEIICRLLYHEQTEPDMSFNVLELSDRYFLLEYINLLQRGIEPHTLKTV